MLKGYKIPGTKERRISVECLVKFFKERNMPMERLFSLVTAKVFLISQDSLLINGMMRESKGKPFCILVIVTPGEVDSMLHEVEPDAIIVDTEIGEQKTEHILTIARQFDDDILLYTVSGSESDNSFLGIANAVFFKTGDLKIIRQLETDMHMRKYLCLP